MSCLDAMTDRLSQCLLSRENPVSMPSLCDSSETVSLSQCVMSAMCIKLNEMSRIALRLQHNKAGFCPHLRKHGCGSNMSTLYLKNRTLYNNTKCEVTMTYDLYDNNNKKYKMTY